MDDNHGCGLYMSHAVTVWEHDNEHLFPTNHAVRIAKWSRNVTESWKLNTTEQQQKYLDFVYELGRNIQGYNMKCILLMYTFVMGEYLSYATWNQIRC